jgi:3-hydroxyisobutyrate dehydrogenase-like beta-hydroxyacid dehydrogenase
LGLAMNLAKEEKVPLYIGALSHQIYSHLITAGLGKKDSSVTIKVLEDLTQIKLRL